MAVIVLKKGPSQGKINAGRRLTRAALFMGVALGYTIGRTLREDEMGKDIDWKGFGHSLLKWAVNLAAEEVADVRNDVVELKRVGKELGVQHIPGEDLNEYRKRVIAARDAKR
ncbi:MAG: hypothetical protein E6Q97_20450 [Desulfurellales bacterium]|nr:MAG: hypothetical protein E6Q97_20450 [Desulfurellales bacterium]